MFSCELFRRWEPGVTCSDYGISCVCVCLCVCVCVCVCVVTQHERRMRHVTVSSVACLFILYFSTLLINTVFGFFLGGGWVSLNIK